MGASALAGILVVLILTHDVLLVDAWGADGHRMICIVGQAMLNPIAATYVEELLPDGAGGNLSSLCSWADEVRYHKDYTWSAPLHFADTPDNLCGYKYKRDCQNDQGTPGFCVAGAIANYTTQLTTVSDQHNQTEALLFLAHFVGDIHQPLHCGFKGDKGGNEVEVYWYSSKTNLHHVWDTDMIDEIVKKFYNDDISAMTAAIHENATGPWKEEASKWASCSDAQIACPNTYAEESVKTACEWAYSDAPYGDGDISDNEVLADDYFVLRVSIVQKRIGQAAVRLASILNLIFPEE